MPNSGEYDGAGGKNFQRKTLTDRDRGAVPAAGSECALRRSASEAMVILSAGDFVEHNWGRIAFRLQKAATDLQQVSPKSRPQSLLNRTRSMLDGIFCLGSSTDRLGEARRYVARRFQMDPARALAILTLVHLVDRGVQAESDEQHGSKQVLWNQLALDVDRIAQELGSPGQELAAPPQELGTPVRELGASAREENSGQPPSR